MPQQVEDMSAEADRLLNENSANDQDPFDLEDDSTIEDEDISAGNVSDDEGGFEQKYNVLRGKYDAEVGRMTNMLSSTMAEKESLALQLKASVNAQVKKESGDDFFLGDNDPEIKSLIEDYPSLAKGIEKYAKKLVEKELVQTKRDVAKVNAETRRETYENRMSDAVKNWREINADPKFIEWLKQKERYTNASRHQLLMNAWKHYDADVTSQFFVDYLKETGQEVQRKENNRQNNLTPDTTTGAPIAGKGGKGVLTRDEISAFYRDRANGKFRGSEEDAAKIEARIIQAVKEGKVR